MPVRSEFKRVLHLVEQLEEMKAIARVKKPGDEGTVSTMGADTRTGGITYERSVVPFLKEGKALYRDIISNQKVYNTLYNSDRAADQRKLKTLESRLLKQIAPLIKTHQKTIEWIKAYADQAGSHSVNRAVQDLMVGLLQCATTHYGPSNLEAEFLNGEGGVLGQVFSGKGSVIWELYLEQAFPEELGIEARINKKLSKNPPKGVKPVKEDDLKRMDKEGLTLYQAHIGVHDPYKHKGTPKLTPEDIEDLAPKLLKAVQAFLKRYETILGDFTDTLGSNQKRITNMDAKYYYDLLRKLQKYNLDDAKDDLAFGVSSIFTHVFGDFVTSSQPLDGLTWGLKTSVPGAIL